MKANNRRLMIAMICYGVLILAALYFLLPVRNSNETFVLAATLFFFALLVVRTIVHTRDED